PEGYAYETQLIANVISADGQNDPDVLALTGASAALSTSDIPFNGPIAGVRVGRIEGKLVVNPTLKQREECDLDLVVACSKEALKAEYGDKYATVEKPAKAIIEDLKYDYMRDMVVNGGRIGNRAHDGVRKITIEVGPLPRTHGSALFTRGETQSLVTTTLGTGDDEQRIESLTGMSFRKFLLHYNFPPFSVNETKPLRGPGRREIGHGALAERALRP